MIRRLSTFTLVLLLSGCGEIVTIQSAEVAKQLNASGFENDVRTTGVTRLDACFTALCPSIVKMSVGRSTNEITIDSIYLPKSNVDVKNIRVGVQWRPRNNPDSVNAIYNELRSEPSEKSNYIRYITTESIWKNYGERIIPARIVDALKDLNVDQVMNTSSELSSKVQQAVEEALVHSPIEVTQLDVINTDVPDQVLQAKYKLFAIEDDKNRQIKQLAVGIEIERQRQALQVKRAENDKDIAQRLGISIAQYMCLKTAEKMSDAADDGKSSVFVNGNCGLGSESSLPVLPH